MMSTTSYPTAAFQASAAPSTSYQQHPNANANANADAGEYGYSYGTGSYNNYSLPTTTAVAQQNTYNAYNNNNNGNGNNNSPYQHQQYQQPTAEGLYAYPDTTPPHSYGSTPNDAKAANNGDKEKTKKRWSLNFRSKNEGNDGAAETPSTATGVANNNNSPKKERRWSLNFRSRNEDESSSEKSSSDNTLDAAATAAAAAAANHQQQLVVYSVPPSETAGQQPPVSNADHHQNNFKQPTELHPEKQAMKQDRKAKMAGAATTGAIIGGVLTGPAWPVGAVAGAAIATYAGKVTARAGERRQQRRWEQKTFNDYLSKGKAGVQSESVAFA